MSAGPEALLSAVGAGRVVVRMPNWLGDALLALPAVRALRRLAPEARLELHARRAVAEVLGAGEALAHEVVVAGRSTPEGVLADARLARGARAAVIFPNSFASALPPWLGRVPVRIGSRRDGRAPLLTHAVALSRTVHQAAAYLALVAPGRKVRAVDGALALRPEARAAGARAAGERPYAVLVPGAAYGPAKRWGAARFGELGRWLRHQGLEVLVLGTRAERPLAEQVADASGGRSLAGETDGATFAGVLAGARVGAVNDSGALHLASALGVPLVALFGATDPARTGPLDPRARVLYHRVTCSPCGHRACPRPVHDCMEAIPPARAAASAAALLESAVGAREGSR